MRLERFIAGLCTAVWLTGCGSNLESLTNSSEALNPSTPGSTTPGSPDPTPSPAQGLSAYPDATNTGVPAGVSLTVHNGDLAVSTAGAVIDAMDIRGALYVNANNVTVRRSKITNASFFQVKVQAGVTGVIIEDCEVSGTGSNNDGSYGIMGSGTFLRNNVHDVENGITPESNTLIQDNYVHDLNASGSPHYDGIQIDGGQTNITMRHNTISNPHNQAAAIMIDNYFGSISNMIVENNRLMGGGFTIYSDARFSSSFTITNVMITNNRLGMGAFGYYAFSQSSPTVSGSIDDITGQPIP